MKRLVVSCIVVIALVAVIATHFLAPTRATRASNTLASVPNGYGYIAYAQIPGSVLKTVVGPLVAVNHGCNTQAPSTASSSVNNLTLGSQVPAAISTGMHTAGALATADVARTKVVTTSDASSTTAMTTATTANVNILNGVIKVTALRAAASSSMTATGASSTDAGTTLVNVKINGKLLIGPIKPNTVIKLANLGYVVLNEQTAVTNNVDQTAISINLIDVHITLSNTLGLSLGTRIIVGHADSEIVRSTQLHVLNATVYDYKIAVRAGGHLTVNVLNYGSSGLSAGRIDRTTSLLPVDSASSAASALPLGGAAPIDSPLPVGGIDPVASGIMPDGTDGAAVSPDMMSPNTTSSQTDAGSNPYTQGTNSYTQGESTATTTSDMSATSTATNPYTGAESTATATPDTSAASTATVTPDMGPASAATTTPDKGAAGNLLTDASGPLVTTVLPCTGGQSTNQAANSFPLSLGHIGVITENVAGTIATTGANTRGQIHIAKLDLLSHMIVIDVLDTKAQAAWNNSMTESASTMLLRARILGKAINATISPNLRISLGNLGYVVLNEQIRHISQSQVSVSVNALDIYITTANAFGLPVGSVITLGHIDLGVRSLT